jgi:hypothetical protein
MFFVTLPSEWKRYARACVAELALPHLSWACLVSARDIIAPFAETKTNKCFGVREKDSSINRIF